MCPEHERLQAYFDGELDAPGAVQFEQHLTTCADCRAELAALQASRGALRTHFAAERAPQPLRASLQRALDAEEQPMRPARAGAA